MARNQPQTAAEEALLTFTRWVASLDEDSETRRRIGLQGIIDRAKLTKKFYEPTRREQLVERIQKIIDQTKINSGYPIDDRSLNAIKYTLPDLLIEEFQTEFSMLLDPDQDGPY